MKYLIFIISIMFGSFIAICITLAVTGTTDPVTQTVERTPPGEPTPPTTLPAEPPVTAWYGGHPATNFVTTSEGKNLYGIYMWHGTIDGIECLIYGNAVMCKGFPAAASAP